VRFLIIRSKSLSSIIEFGGDVGPRVPGTNERHDRGALMKFHTILRYQFGERAGYQCIVQQPMVDEVWDGLTLVIDSEGKPYNNWLFQYAL
jgi:hypothetical protein